MSFTALVAMALIAAAGGAAIAFAIKPTRCRASETA